MVQSLSAVVLFDGVCNLCNGVVRFVVRRDPRARFHFAALQSEAGKRLLERSALTVPPMGTIVLISGLHTYTRSGAALRIAMGLQGFWPLLGVFLLVPAFIRDAVYDFVAAHRYCWFGKSELCEIPTPSEADRFLR